MNGLDLFTGSGIGSLTLKHTIPNYRTCRYVENDPYCQAVLIARIKDGLLDDAPIWDDVRTFDGTKWRGKVDIISGGFPCQPFSVAGQRQGETDKRNLWPDTVRIIGEVRPRYAFLENAPGLLSSGYFETILCDLAKIGYDIEWDVVGASDVGANHRRKRLWILAYTTELGRWSEDSKRLGMAGHSLQRQERQENTDTPETQRSDVADSTRDRNRQKQDGSGDARFQHNSSRRSGMGGEPCNGSQDVADSETKQNGRGRQPRGNAGGISWWQVEPPVGRVADGVAFRVDRLKMLGNGWVPQVVVRILKVGVNK